MDAFYATVPIRRKTRVHFHAFMRDVHEELATLKQEPDPLATVAARIARRFRLVCFDEFHVADIADAMILGRLLEALFAAGVVFVMTSNYAPDGLYPERAAAAERSCRRSRSSSATSTWSRSTPASTTGCACWSRSRPTTRRSAPDADAALLRAFERMRGGPDEDPRLAIEGRTLTARRRAGSAVWFDFATLCDGPRSQRDYLELAERFSVLLLSGVPRMTAEMGDRARRFTWLVDILYDHRVKLLVAAAVRPEALYRDGPNSQEFPRTASRLDRDADPRLHGAAAPVRPPPDAAARRFLSRFPRSASPPSIPRRFTCKNSRPTGRSRTTRS